MRNQSQRIPSDLGDMMGGAVKGIGGPLKNWRDNFRARMQEPDDEGYINVDGYRVNQSYQYYDPELDQLFDFSTPYGRRAMEMMRAMRNPLLSEEEKNEIMQRYGNDASEEEWEQSRQFVDRVNQRFGGGSSMPAQSVEGGKVAPDAAQIQKYRDAHMQEMMDTPIQATKTMRPLPPSITPAPPLPHEDEWPRRQ